jgi:hypothetical protein
MDGWMAMARRRVNRWLGGRDSEERNSEPDSQGSGAGRHGAGSDEVWRHADQESLRVERSDGERPGLSTYDPAAGRAHPVDEPERSPRSRRAADGQGLHDGEA